MATSKKVLQIEMNKGHYEVIQSKDQEVRYEIIEPKRKQDVDIRVSDEHVSIDVPKDVRNFHMRLFVPAERKLEVSLTSGILDLVELGNPLEAKVENGNLVVVPLADPRRQYELDLKVTSGILVYKAMRNTPAKITADVQVGLIRAARFCRVESSQRNGWTGMLQKLICGENHTASHNVSLKVYQGTISIGKE